MKPSAPTGPAVVVPAPRRGARTGVLCGESGIPLGWPGERCVPSPAPPKTAENQFPARRWFRPGAARESCRRFCKLYRQSSIYRCCSRGEEVWERPNRSILLFRRPSNESFCSLVSISSRKLLLLLQRSVNGTLCLLTVHSMLIAQYQRRRSRNWNVDSDS